MNASLAKRYDTAEVFEDASDYMGRGSQSAPVWSKPDMTVLAGGRTAPPDMPRDMFGDLWPLVRDLAAGAGAPAEYVAVSIIAVAASLIGAKRSVQPFATAPQWREPCVLWIAPVGDPSSNKSPAIDAATGPLKGMEKELAEQFKSGLIGWQTTAERAKAEKAAWLADVKTATKEGVATPSMPDAAVEPDEPQRPRLMVQDGTPEAVMEILSGNPNGILHLRDELAGWLMSFDRYSPGGREFWLEANGGRHFTVDRKSLKAPLFIKFNGVTVLGGIQPEKLSQCLLKAADDGLVARFLWAWPDPIRYQRPTGVADVALLERIYRRLLGLQPARDEEGQAVAIVLMLNDAAGAIFEEWIRDNDAAICEAAGLHKGFLGKLRGMVLRLSLVIELIGWASGNGPEPTCIRPETLTAVLEFIEDYAKPSALRVFGDAALPLSERNAAALARHILQTKAQRINLRDVRRESGIATLKIAADVEAATEALVEAGWLRGIGERAGDTAGKPRKDYLVNPMVHDGVANGVA